jgi:hypothetical protein
VHYPKNIEPDPRAAEADLSSAQPSTDAAPKFTEEREPDALPGAAHLFSHIRRMSRHWAGEPPSSASDTDGGLPSDLADTDLSSPLALAEAFQHLDADVACEERSLVFDLEDTDFPCIALLDDGTSICLVRQRETAHGRVFDVDVQNGYARSGF